MNLGAGKKQLARILMKKREVKMKIVPRLLDHEKMVLENVQPLQRMLQQGEGEGKEETTEGVEK